MLIKEKEQFDAEKQLWERNNTGENLIEQLKKELELRDAIEKRNQCELSRLKRGILSK